MSDPSEHAKPVDARRLTTQARKHWLGGQREQARQCIDRAVELAPDSAEVSAIQAVLYLDESERGLRTSPDLELFDKAMASARRAVDLDPSWPMAHTILGRLHLANGDKAQAAKLAATAIGLDPDHVESQVLLGDLDRHAGDRAGATARYSLVTPAPMAVDRLRAAPAGGTPLWGPCLIALGIGVVLRLAGATALGAIASMIGLGIAVVILAQAIRDLGRRRAAKHQDTGYLLAPDGELARRIGPAEAP